MCSFHVCEQGKKKKRRLIRENWLYVFVLSVCFPCGSQLGRFLRADALLASHLNSQAD